MQMKQQKGQSIVEMTLVVPFILIIVVGGIIDFGFTMFNLITLQQLANDVCEYSAEGRGKFGISDPASLTAYLNNGKKPTFWSGNFHPVNPPLTLKVLDDVVVTTTSSTTATIRRILLTYNSPIFTPFWQSVSQVAGRQNNIEIAAMAAYQIPNVVATR